MRMLLSAAAATVAMLVSANSVLADGFRPVTERGEFISLVTGRSLQIPVYGVDLKVSSDGAIRGKGAGRSVTGQWRWSGGFFCRDLYWGKRDLGPNCQEVRVSGNKMRFTSDRGSGRSADFRLR